MKGTMTKLRLHIWRAKKIEHATTCLKCLICTLVLMETPWECTLAIALSLTLLGKAKKNAEWSIDRLKKCAQEGLKARPSLLHEVHNHNAKYTVQARTKNN